jgi:hypothetical protein
VEMHGRTDESLVAMQTISSTGDGYAVDGRRKRKLTDWVSVCGDRRRQFCGPG